jgi:dihydroorotase
MSRSLTVRGAQLVLPDRVVVGDLLVEDGIITEIGPRLSRSAGPVIEAAGLVALPGMVDSHARLDGADGVTTWGAACLAGGITSAAVVGRASTTAQLHAELQELAERSPVHFGLVVRVLEGADAALAAAGRAIGVWIDPGSFTDSEEVFRSATGLVVVDHQDAGRLDERWRLWPGPVEPADWPKVHDIDSCVAGLRRTLDAAARFGTRVHVLSVSTAEELALLTEHHRVTAAVGAPNLFSDARAYDDLGLAAIHGPPIRGPRHPAALWEGLHQGRLWVSSAHAPVTLSQKMVPLPSTPIGWPTAEWVLPLMLDAASRGRCTLRDVAKWTSRAPAEGLGLPRKGRLEIGYDADLVLIDPLMTRAVASAPADIRTAAGWSPWAGRELTGWPVHTIVGGESAWTAADGDLGVLGRELKR